MKTIQLVYNEINKNGNYKSVYFDTHGKSSNEGYFLKIIENGQMRLFELSTEQISEMYQIISRFINGFDAYHYNDFNSADTDYTLLVSIHSDDPMFPNQGQQYYNWQDAKHIPKGVEFLLEFFNKFNYKG